jgi:hypothetical protein
MKKIAFLIIITISSIGFAQDSSLVKKNIAIVPFMEQMYFNDLSRLWSRTGESNSQEQQIKDISKQLFTVLRDSLKLKYHLIDLEEASTLSTSDYSMQMYSLTAHAYADTFPQKKQKSKIKLRKKKKEKANDIKASPKGEIGQDKVDIQYQFLNAQIRNIKDYKKLCSELELDGVLFVNQIEIKGDYGSPYNSGRETNYYIIIHYALYNNNADLCLGNKTNNITTNEKARYQHFLKEDLIKAAQNMSAKIKAASLVQIVK